MLTGNTDFHPHRRICVVWLTLYTWSILICPTCPKPESYLIDMYYVHSSTSTYTAPPSPPPPAPNIYTSTKGINYANPVENTQGIYPQIISDKYFLISRMMTLTTVYHYKSTMETNAKVTDEHQAVWLTYRSTCSDVTLMTETFIHESE